MTSWLVGPNEVNSRWEGEVPEKRKTGQKLGGDSGAVDMISLSDGQKTPKDAHGYDMM